MRLWWSKKTRRGESDVHLRAHDRTCEGCPRCDEWWEADLEIARIRDLLGTPANPRYPDSLNHLARVLNRAERGDFPAQVEWMLTEVDDAQIIAEGYEAIAELEAEEAAIAARKFPRLPGRSRRPRSAEPSRRRHLAFGAHRTLSASLVGAASVGVLVMTVATVLSAAPAIATPPMLDFALEVQDLASAPDAAAVVHELASTAAASALPGSGNVSLVATSGWNLSVDTDRGAQIRPFDVSLWIGPDSSARAEQVTSAPLSMHGTLATEAMPGAEAGEAVDVLPPGEIPTIDSLPISDQADLQAKLLEGGLEGCFEPGGAASCMLGSIANLARTYALPAEVASALWDALGDAEGVHYLGETHDRIGRDVYALVTSPSIMAESSWVLVVLADPSTGRVVGAETVTLKAPFIGSEPLVTDFFVVKDATMVSAVGEAPGN